MGDKFVGRCKSMNSLKYEWKEKQKRIFGISGSMSVGKTRYAKEFLQDLKKSDENDKYKIVSIDFKSVETLEEYLKTIDRCLSTSIQDAKAIVQYLKNSEGVYIFHHDHQEYARLKSSSGEELTKPSQDSLWDKIYESVVKKLLEDTGNFYLIISSTDEFRFAEFRNLFWSQKLLELTEEESLELLDGVWPSAEKDKESRRHIVRLCNGVPSAIINTGLLLDEGAFVVKEALILLLQHIIQFLSDESLPNSEKIRKQLLCRWNNLKEAQMDNLMKSLVIINNTCRITVEALAKLHQEYHGVAEFKLLYLLPLLRRNLLSVNKDDNSVIACPLIQHMLEAVDYIDTDALRNEIKAQISALLKPKEGNGDNCCKSLPKESTTVNEPSEDSASRSVDVQRPPGIDDQECALAEYCRQSSRDDDNNETAKNSLKTLMESNQFVVTPEQSFNLSNDENEFQDLKNPSGFQKRRQNSFIGENLDHDFSEKGYVYGDKDMHCSGDLSTFKQDSATDRKQSNIQHSTDRMQDCGGNSDKLEMSNYKHGPEISLSGELSFSSDGKLLQSPGYHTNNSEPNTETSSLNQSLPSLTQDTDQQLVTVSGLMSIETNRSGCNQDISDGADADSENSKHMSRSFQMSPKNKLGETSSRTSVEPKTNIPCPSLQFDVTLSGESNIPVQNLHRAQTSQVGLIVQSTDVQALNPSNTGSPTTHTVEAEGQNRSKSCSDVRFLIDDRSFSCDESHCPREARGFPNQNATGFPTQHMPSDVSESAFVTIEHESRESESTNSVEGEANETTSSLSSISIRGLMQGIVEIYKSTE